jgi:cysteine synthase
MHAPDEIDRRPTPLLRWGEALLKLELLRPSGTTSDRAAEEWEWRGAGGAVIEASGNEAIAAAGWARRSGVQLAIVPRGLFTHEMRETLKLWGVRVDPHLVPTLPSLDSEGAVRVFTRTLGKELIADLAAPPALLVAPAGERAALLGALAALREKWPAVRGVALLAAPGANDELPDLPRDSALPAGIERVLVTRAEASRGRARVARELGLLASHASAAAAVYAHEHGGVALITAPGEREFSLESTP